MAKAEKKRHLRLIAKEFQNEPINESNTPSGGWCNSCERYDCGHFINRFGDVILNKKLNPEQMWPIDGYIGYGTKCWFEYHCWEDHRSSDALVWYRSHQQVTVLNCVNKEYGDLSQKDRYELGHQLVYRVRFEDGFEWDAFEDELLYRKNQFQRPEPPAPQMLLLWPV